VNAIAWAPHEFGAILACASSDGKVSTVSQNPDGTWESSKPFAAHTIGCNAVSWAPAAAPALGSGPGGAPVKRIATGGCDNLVKIWRYDHGPHKGAWADSLLSDRSRDARETPSGGGAAGTATTSASGRWKRSWRTATRTGCGTWPSRRARASPSASSRRARRSVPGPAPAAWSPSAWRLKGGCCRSTARGFGAIVRTSKSSSGARSARTRRGPRYAARGPARGAAASRTNGLAAGAHAALCSG